MLNWIISVELQYLKPNNRVPKLNYFYYLEMHETI